MSSQHGYLAAIDTTGLYVAEATGIKHYGGAHAEPSYSLQFLLTVAEAYHISQLWVHGSLEQHLHDFQAPQWDIQPAPEGQVKRWYHAFRPGAHGDGIDLAFPAHDDASSWREAESAAELLADLVTFNAALGLNYRRSPGSTGIALMRDVHLARGIVRTQMDTISTPPPPAVLPTYGAPAKDLNWIRPLTEHEKTLAWGHVYDKNAAYLAACAALELGLGSYELWSMDDLDHVNGFDASKLLPGYYHVEEAHSRADWPLPSILDPDGELEKQARAQGRSGYWVMAPALQAALQAGWFVDVSEAYVYPRHSRVLAPWEARLRDAGELMGHNDLCHVIRKQVYTQSIQWLTLPGDGQSSNGKRPTLYHPDWQHAIVSMTAANMWRNALAAIKKGGLIPAIWMKDTLLMVTDNPLPAEHAEQVGLRIGRTPGMWKIKAANIPMEALRPAFDVIPANGGPSMGLSILRRVIAEQQKAKAREVVHA